MCGEKGARRTHLLDVIGGYGLVVAVYGSLSYDDNVQPLLIGAVLKKENHRKSLASPDAGTWIGGSRQRYSYGS